MPTFMGWGGTSITTAGWGGSGAGLLGFFVKPKIRDSLELRPSIVDSEDAGLKPDLADSKALVPKITDSEGPC